MLYQVLEYQDLEQKSLYEDNKKMIEEAYKKRQEELLAIMNKND